MTASTTPIINVTGRALLVSDTKLLLVSNSGDFWYTPGGRVDPGESLRECITREVLEECGLEVEVGELLHVAEFFEVSENRHKIECYFLANLRAGDLSDDWLDKGGPVVHRRFFALDELRLQGNVYPQFLGEGSWLSPKSAGPVYRGYERR